MNILKAVLLFVLVGLFFISCGGTKKLSPEDLSTLSPQEKAEHLEAYLNEHPDDIASKKELADAYEQMGMDDRAAIIIKDILSVEPYQADLQFKYGQMMYKKGETKIAFQAFRKVLDSPGGSMYLNEIAKYVGGRFVIQPVTQSAANESFPSFLPDGSGLVYQTDENGNWDVVKHLFADNSVETLLQTRADEELPVISPDGGFLLYTSNADDQRPINTRFKVREIYLRNLSSGQEKNLTETVSDDWLPRFSPDGQQIVFVTERSDLRQVAYTAKQSDIYLMESDGDFHTRLTKNESNDGGACFSPDGKKIYFHSNRNGSYGIMVMNADGSKQMTVLDEPDVDEVNPCVSPDGNSIVFYSNKNGNYDLYLYDLTTNEQLQLTFSPADDSAPYFSPDGKSIVFHSNRSGNYDIYILNLEAESEPDLNQIASQLDDLIAQ
ncbi:MAG: hypothetical protein Kow0037_09140 [Calditrichia bacterium]